jgi:hypothetical protein
MVPAAQELAEGDEICAVNALIWLLLLENRDQWDLVAEDPVCCEPVSD